MNYLSFDTLKVAFLNLPLWSIAHRDDELHADEENTGVVENVEDICTDIVAERIDCGIPKWSSHKVEGKIEVGLRKLAMLYKNVVA